MKKSAHPYFKKRNTIKPKRGTQHTFLNNIPLFSIESYFPSACSVSDFFSRLIFFSVFYSDSQILLNFSPRIKASLETDMHDIDN